MKKIVELKKYRNFDQTIDDSLTLFKMYVKQILIFMWKNNKILISALLITYFLYSYYASETIDLNVIFNRRRQPEQPSLANSLITLVLYILGLMFNIRLMLTVYGFIKSHINYKGIIVEEDIVEDYSGKFWKYFGALLFIGLIVFFIAFGLGLLYMIMALVGKFIGALLWFIIFFIFMIYVLSLANIYFSAIFFENVDVFEAFSRSMRYIKNRFWYAIAVMFIMLVIIFFFSLLFNLPLMIYLFSKIFLAFESKNVEISNQGNLFLSIYSVFSYIADVVLQILMLITGVVLYFSLREAKTAESVYEKIESIGKDIGKFSTKD